VRALVAPLSAAVFLLLALTAGSIVPFARFPVFRFPSTEGRMAVPVLLADGHLASVEDFIDYSGIDPQRIDVEHIGLGSIVQHRFEEQRSWIQEHQAPPGAPEGPVSIEVGIRVLTTDPEKGLVIGTRIDARGKARRR
jgi:hypothetical protein